MVVHIIFYRPFYTWIVAKILNAMGILRIPKDVELAGLDYIENQATASDNQAIVAAELAEANAGSSV